MIKITGKNNISATIIADSVNISGQRITTFEFEYPRYIHAELLTHRMFSKNAASSRAIPLQKAIHNVLDNPAYPIHWGKNQAGMQANEELSEEDRIKAKRLWDRGIKFVTILANRFDKLGCHKQYASRWLETPQMYKCILTGTEFSNFLNLRDHSATQPEFRELAYCIRIALESSVPTLMYDYHWHMPYVESDISFGTQTFYVSLYNEEFGEITKEVISLNDALKISSSCCAQVSYRSLDKSIEKSIYIYNKLVNMDVKHLSPFEHQAKPICPEYPNTEWEKGVTHKDRKGYLWSANFKGWIQHRHLIDC